MLEILWHILRLVFSVYSLFYGVSNMENRRDVRNFSIANRMRLDKMYIENISIYKMWCFRWLWILDEKWFARHLNFGSNYLLKVSNKPELNTCWLVKFCKSLALFVVHALCILWEFGSLVVNSGQNELPLDGCKSDCIPGARRGKRWKAYEMANESLTLTKQNGFEYLNRIKHSYPSAWKFVAVV